MTLSAKQRNAAKRALARYDARCLEMGAQQNQHYGVAAFMIARALMAVTWGLKYYQAQQWALNFLAEERP